MALFYKSVGQYTSSLYEIARGLIRSRDNQAAKAAQLAEVVLELQAENQSTLERTESTARAVRTFPAVTRTSRDGNTEAA